MLAQHLSHLKKDFENLVKNKDLKCNTVNYLSGRLSQLAETLATATSNYEELLDTVEEVEKLERVEECFDSIRETYFNYRSALLDALDQIQSSQQKEVKQVPEAMPATSNSADLQLPNVKLPVFSGSYETWRNFRDMFISIIHSNSALSNVKKMHYLKSSVSDEAEKLLSHLRIDNGNYTRAWEILTNRYGHTRFLVNTQLKVFFNKPSMSQERADSIKELLDTSTEVSHNLSNLKVPVQHWDTILLFVLLQKLPNKTQQLWEERLGSKADSKELFPLWLSLSSFWNPGLGH